MCTVDVLGLCVNWLLMTRFNVRLMMIGVIYKVAGKVAGRFVCHTGACACGDPTKAQQR